MASSGEPVEITALARNLGFISDTVTVGPTLQWFANKLVEKAFVPRDIAQKILGIHGTTPAEKAGQLMDAVFAKVRGTDRKRHWFNEFVDIFSYERAHQELAEKLRKEGIEVLCYICKRELVFF